MKTFFQAPIPPSRCPQKVFAMRDEMNAVLAAESDSCQIVRLLHKIFKSYFNFDYLMLNNPSETPLKNQAVIYPFDQRGARAFGVTATREQVQTILNEKNGTLVRIADKGDISSTATILQRLFPGRDFSMLWLRSNIGGKYICRLTFCSEKPDAFDEKHVAAIFVISGLMIKYWTECALKLREYKTMAQGDELGLEKLPGMSEVLDLIYKVTRQECPVLILGETGVGKEVAANAIYRGSPRYGSPYIKINCGNIPESLVESELFGHEKGAFTSATHSRKGRFERADRGVLMLDELGELPLMAQTRLLRALQENVIERVGGEKEIHLDVRIIAATHRDLLELTRQGRFREDLYYRLNIFPIRIPPLRERPVDIPVLLEHFIYKACVKQGYVDVPKLAASAIKALCSWSWPGNIRELQNAVERAVILWQGDKKHFHIEPGKEARPWPLTVRSPLRPGEETGSEDYNLDAVCAAHIRKVLKMCNGKISGKGGAAELLGLKPSTLRFRMNKLGIIPDSDITA